MILRVKERLEMGMSSRRPLTETSSELRGNCWKWEGKIPVDDFISYLYINNI